MRRRNALSDNGYGLSRYLGSVGYTRVTSSSGYRETLAGNTAAGRVLLVRNDWSRQSPRALGLPDTVAARAALAAIDGELLFISSSNWLGTPAVVGALAAEGWPFRPALHTPLHSPDEAQPLWLDAFTWRTGPPAWAHAVLCAAHDDVDGPELRANFSRWLATAEAEALPKISASHT